MITKNDIKESMLEFVDKHITFMFSQSGIPNDYNIYLAKMVKPCDNRSIRFTFQETYGRILHCADLEYGFFEFYDIEEFKAYIFKFFEIS